MSWIKTTIKQPCTYTSTKILTNKLNRCKQDSTSNKSTPLFISHLHPAISFRNQTTDFSPNIFLPSNLFNRKRENQFSPNITLTPSPKHTKPRTNSSTPSFEAFRARLFKLPLYIPRSRQLRVYFICNRTRKNFHTRRPTNLPRSRPGSFAGGQTRTTNWESVEPVQKVQRDG